MRFSSLLALCVLAATLISQAEGLPKGHCPKLTKAQLKKANFGKYTEKNKKCKCWWDLSRNDCACCKNKNSMQCGYPMHRFCYKKSKQGCPGVCNRKYTFSQKGFPCFWDHSSTDCAWCADNGYQCVRGKATGPEAKDGSRCQNGMNKKYCDSVLGDCRHIPKYDVNAKCMFKRSFGKYIQIFEPRCNPGYTGNGIQCFNKDGQLSVNPETQVEVKLKLTNDFYTHPHVNGEFSYGREMDGLFKQMENAANGACMAGNCQATYNHTEMIN